ncbi:hypothetical protein RJ639_043507 [Escallonia herrerae]|uniref:Uncharacterized protein n=1 Tax=Escallonia herrerae TaxID=1293975 RepID=A0AA88WBI8_9ASTE|nr:hypothetical protein RJ639_043507 [Escallonia herrerae]
MACSSFFRHWKSKMYFFLAALKIAFMLTFPRPVVQENADEATKQVTAKRKKKLKDDVYCKTYSFRGLFDTHYYVYEIKHANSTAKELWDDLDRKYKTKDSGNKKLLIRKLFDFHVVDRNFVITQIHELQMIMNLIISEGHSLDESFQVSKIIFNLPFTWKECRKELKQKKDAMTMQELVKYIQVEENSHNFDRLELEDHKSSKALVVDHDPSLRVSLMVKVLLQPKSMISPRRLVRSPTVVCFIVEIWKLEFAVY